MKKSLSFALLCLTGVSLTATQWVSFASPREITPPEISQVMLTQYTGSGGVPFRPAEPIYRLLLRQDGTAIYVGSATYMKRIGRYQGKVEQKDFIRLANLFRQDAFPNWRRHDSQLDSSAFASEKFEMVGGGKKKGVVVYEERGALAARRASKVFYGLLWKIRWHKVSDSDAISE